MTRTRIVLAATTALLAAGLSGCAESTAASGPVAGNAAPEPLTRAAPPPSPAPAAEATTSPRLCQVEDLTLAAHYVDAGAGTAHHALQFTNTGDRTCEVRGFPGVSHVGGDDGHQIGRPAERVGSKGPGITLTPGARAWAPLAMTRPDNYDPTTCRPEQARGLRVYPPQEHDSAFVPFPHTACANPDLPGDPLTVKTLQQGSPS